MLLLTHNIILFIPILFCHGRGCSLTPRLLPAFQHCTTKTREPGKTYHVSDVHVAGGTLSWFHPLHHSRDKFYQAPSFFSCNVEKLGGASVQHDLASLLLFQLLQWAIGHKFPRSMTFPENSMNLSKLRACLFGISHGPAKNWYVSVSLNLNLPLGMLLVVKLFVENGRVIVYSMAYWHCWLSDMLGNGIAKRFGNYKLSYRRYWMPT